MDSALQLALMTKAKKVFGADDTFLSFPVSPLPYTKRDLDFFSARDADDVRQSQRNLQAFSTLVNLIPDDEAWSPTETLFLWDVYKQVLLEGDFATSARTPEEEATYQKALAFLRTARADGVWEDSAPLKAYRQHKDAYLVAEQKYVADKSTGEHAADETERRRWRDVTEPAQRANLTELSGKWITAGHKNEVEVAQAKVVSLGARSPILTWSEWKGRFNADIDTLTSAEDSSTVYPSFFSPSNAIDDHAWQSFKLGKEEVKVLINEASPELRARFAADSKKTSGKSLTFEFSSAAIQRPWFMSDAFRARFWRFPDKSRIVSDGGRPAKGPCPAYVTAVVFARRMKEEKPKPSFWEKLGKEVLSSATTATAKGFQFDALSGQEKPRTAAPTPAQPAAALKGVPKHILADFAGTLTGGGKNAEVKPVTAPEASAKGLRNLQTLSFQRPVEPSPQLSPAANPASAPSEPVQDDSIYILAFICKSLPKCPDPDPTLQW